MHIQWYSEPLRLVDQPPESVVTLSGIYNPPTSNDPTIVIKVLIQTTADATARELILYSQYLHSMTHDVPDPGDIESRYKAKLHKFRIHLEKKTLQELEQMK